MKASRSTLSTFGIVAATFVIALLSSLPSAAAQSQKKSPPPPRPRPQPAQPRPKPATKPTGTKLYENKENQFSLRAPAAWTEGGGSGLVSLTIVATPEISPAPHFDVKLIQTDSPISDLDAAVDWLKADYTKQNKDAKIRGEIQPTKVGGEDARILTVDNAKSPGSVERATITMHDGKVLVCALAADDAKSYQRAQTMTDSVVRTFKWLDKKPTPPAATQPASPTASN